MFDNILRGIGWGLFFAVGFSILALVVQLFAAPESGWSGPPSLGTAIGVYFLGGVLVGAVVGLLRPFSKRLIGAAVVGLVGGLGFAALVVVFREGTLALTRTDIEDIFILGLGWGPLAGIIMHFIMKE